MQERCSFFVSGAFCVAGGKRFQGGFTLLEMLVIITLLAAIAAIASGTMYRVAETANDQLVIAEMQEIAKAIRQFKQDTGYYPKQGPFDLEGSGSIPLSNLPSYAGSSDAAKRRWFYSPANHYQITGSQSPLLGTDHLLESWMPESGRGWRGPYLTGFAEGYLDIRDGINGGTGAGDPLDGTNIENVDGIADPFEHRTEKVSSGDTLLDWSREVDGREREVWGRPYLVFGLDDSPWIVSMGPDGEFNTADDITLSIK
ncbi:MAG: prepilin-type N-terminal cleavage/methylation domain-containing protein [Chromatiales bacterium]|nr:prepilin-type N-terminal cleavage/methylation domain-containing protein [Chromatiales bacterium]